MLGNALSYTSTAVNALTDPISLFPGVQNYGTDLMNKAKDYVVNNRFVKLAKDSCIRVGTDLYNKSSDYLLNNRVSKGAFDLYNKAKDGCSKVKDYG